MLHNKCGTGLEIRLTLSTFFSTFGCALDARHIQISALPQERYDFPRLWAVSRRPEATQRKVLGLTVTTASHFFFRGSTHGQEDSRKTRPKKAARAPRMQPLRFAHPFFTTTPVTARAVSPRTETTSLSQFAAEKLGPIPPPTRNAMMDLKGSKQDSSISLILFFLIFKCQK